VAEITAHLFFALISNEAIADMATDVNSPTQRVMECGTYAETEGEAPPHEGIAAPREENTAEVAPQKEKLDHSAVNALSSELISARLTAIGKLVNSQNQEKILDLFILKSIGLHRQNSDKDETTILRILRILFEKQLMVLKPSEFFLFVFFVLGFKSQFAGVCTLAHLKAVLLYQEIRNFRNKWFVFRHSTNTRGSKNVFKVIKNNRLFYKKVKMWSRFHTEENTSGSFARCILPKQT